MRDESTVINEILALAPVAERENVRELLNKSIALRSSDEKTNALFRELTQIRQSATKAADVSKWQAEAPPISGRTVRNVQVKVALVPVTSSHKARVVLIRTPDDNGRPTVLLRAEDATPADLSLGLSAAEASVRNLGPNPTKASRVSIRGTAGELVDVDKSIMPLFHMLQDSTEKTVLTDLGTVKSLTIARRIGSPPSKKVRG